MTDDRPYEKALKRAYRLLAYRGRSVPELRTRLWQAGFNEDVAERVVERLRTQGYLDDETFARDWARNCAASKLWGDRKIALSLKEKGVGEETIAVAIEAARREIDERTAMKKLLAKGRRAWGRGGGASEALSMKEKARIYRNLLGRGFDPGRIHDVLGAMEEEFIDDRE
ncbi:MAG: RecX family transcriptional regulator [Deltaproteobacteria bacterium]|nr:RecX family transcriptional regulator [Deltaproteobacteria bacterium]